VEAREEAAAVAVAVAMAAAVTMAVAVAVVTVVAVAVVAVTVVKEKVAVATVVRVAAVGGAYAGYAARQRPSHQALLHKCRLCSYNAYRFPTLVDRHPTHTMHA
jgi:hypothetical protein